MEKKLNFVKNGVIRLPPGFRFHPTDEELVMQYLRRKVFSYPLPASIIPDIDLCKYEPWDLPGDTEQERYFFSTKEAKYKNGNRPNRATSSGYWKATGLDKKILLSKSQNQVVGMKKTLVFYKGKPSNATRTDWIMHEYRLLVENSVQENWVLCRIFLKKRNTKNGMENKEVIELTLGRPRFIDFMTRDNNLSSSSSSSSSSCSSGVTEASSSDENSFTSSSCRKAP